MWYTRTIAQPVLYECFVSLMLWQSSFPGDIYYIINATTCVNTLVSTFRIIFPGIVHLNEKNLHAFPVASRR